MREVLKADARTKLFTQVSCVRVEAGSLLEALSALDEAIASQAPAAAAAVATAEPESASSQGVRGEAVEAVLEAAVDEWESARETAALEAKRRELADLLEGETDLYEYAEDTWSVVKGLSRLQDRWPEGFPEEAAWLATAAKQSRKILQEVVYYCSKVTVPGDVEGDLANLRVGKPLDFGTAFKATLPDQEQRKQILTELSNRHIGGWVDIAAELIYKLSPTRFGRIATCVAPFLLALVAAGLMYVIPLFDLPSSWNLGEDWELVGAFGLVIAGAVIHLLVENVKQLQSRSVPIVAITEGTYWLNLRWIGLLLTVLWALVVTIGLRVLNFDTTGSEGAMAFLAAGYSLDSVAGLILTRFDSTAGVLLRNVESAVTGTGSGGAAPDTGPAASA